MDIIFPPASAAFDYDTLPPEVAAEAKSIVADARALHKQTLEKAETSAGGSSTSSPISNTVNS